MEINLFQILILLFIFYPLIRRFLDGMKPQEQDEPEVQEADNPWETQHPGQTRHQTRRSVPSETGREDRAPVSGRKKEGEGQSWEDFFEGLEEVLSGKEPDPSPVPQHRQETESAKTSSSHRDSGVRDQRHPLEGPVYETASGRSSESASGSTYRTGRSSSASRTTGRRAMESTRSGQTRDAFTRYRNIPSGLADEVSRELTDSDNPIYTDLDEAPMVSVQSESGRKYAQNVLGKPEKIRDAIILKTILDPPLSRRHHSTHY